MNELEIGAGAGRSPRRRPRYRVLSKYDPEPLLRRMLAVGDVLAVAAAAIIVGLLGSGAAAALLLVLSAPIWIVTAKLAGLYDRDHRTLRHLTVDELPWLVVWTLSSTALLTMLLAPFPALDLSSGDRLLVWGTLLGLGFLFRAFFRGLWRRITPPQRVLIVGEGRLLRPSCESSSSSPTSTRDPRPDPSCAELHERLHEIVENVDRVVIACSELNEGLLERLLPVCRANGVKLTIVPPTRGMFGTATHLTHIADLPCSTTTPGTSRGRRSRSSACSTCVVALIALVRDASALRPRRARDRCSTPAFRSSSARLAADARRGRSRCSSSARWCATPRRGCRSSSGSTIWRTRCSSSGPTRA